MYAPAKVNLFLAVDKRDERGYHPLKTVFQPMAQLRDKVIVEETGKPGILISCNNPAVPNNRTNTAYRAVELMAELARKDLGSTGVRIMIEKYVPLSSGLGGSALDAAPVIKTLNELWKMNLSIEQMERVGSQIGADVPQAIRNRTCYAEGYGDKILYEFSLKPIHVCIVVPEVYLSSMNGEKTKFLYKKIDENVREPIVHEELMIAALQSGNWEYVGKLMRNDFEPTVFKLHPELRKLKETMLECNAMGSLLAGSGGAVFGIFRSVEEVHFAMERLMFRGNVRLVLQDKTV